MKGFGVASILFSVCMHCNARSLEVSTGAGFSVAAEKSVVIAEPEKPETETWKGLHLEVFYETKCPYSQQLIKDINYIINDLGPHFNLSMYPFGNADAIPMDQVSDGYKFWHDTVNTSNKSSIFLCQHGESECLGNMIHLCVADMMNASSYIPYFDCMANQPDASIEMSSYDCAKRHELDLDAIKSCALSPEANSKMIEVAGKTESHWIGYTPWVLLNGQHAVSAEKGDIKKLICTALIGTGLKPWICSTIELLQVSAGVSAMEHQSRTYKDRSQPAISQGSTNASAWIPVNKSAPYAVANPLRIQVYYESRCPYSLSVIRDLHRLWSTDFRHYLTVDLLPFGNGQAIPMAQVSEGYKFWHPEVNRSGVSNVFKCQHGEMECLGNMIHACTINVTGDANKYVPYFGCMAERYGESIEKTSFECSKDHLIDLNATKECVTSVDGNILMSEIANRTADNKVGRTYVPWVQLNGWHTVSAENGNMLKVLCTAMLGQGVQPEACHEVELLQTASASSPAGSAASGTSITVSSPTFAMPDRASMDIIF
eukprot:gnl/TRDRNA2_/TRDRNA2_135642_c0_seq1.p1 gnl/TRDRNA2_/TRDRNA2_135642_c0~~gnl/TRDRNA2_/TRDRNA2_135642_c0_seq1.p1  ORF type:complete len:543 (+),score=82.38 gnl/TRDRNA2_/TRDRNA2_135642_c0_seq1:52-1680(+)